MMRNVIVLSSSLIRGLLGLSVFCFAMPASAFLPGAGFWKYRAARLQFTSGSLSLYSRNCSSAITVRAVNSSGIATNVSSNLTVNLSNGGSALFYSDAACLNPITSVVISAGSNASAFYLKDDTVESITVTASAAPYLSATQSHSVATNPYIWTGNGANTLWATGANWSGGTAPGAGQIALFNNTCATKCNVTIGSAINVGGIRTESNYTGIITQSAQVTLGGAGWVQQGGTFAGGTSNFTVNSGSIAITDGAFQATNATTSILSSGPQISFTITSPATFSSNSGTLLVGGGVRTLNFPSNTSLSNFILGNYSNGEYHSINGNPIVNGTLTVNIPNNGTIVGIITAKGSVIFQDCSGSPEALLILAGDTGVTQTISGAAPNYILPLSIQSSGTVDFNTTGTPTIIGPFTYSSGNINWTNPNIRFIGNWISGTTVSSKITSGGLEFQNVVFGNLNGSHIELTDSMVINGNLSTVYYSCSVCRGITGGSILLKGNFTSNSNWASYGAVGVGGIATPITFGGSTQQTWTETASSLYNTTITIANSAGVHFTTGSSIVGTTPGGSFTTNLTTGDFDMNGGSFNVNSLNLNGRTFYKTGGTLKVNGATVGTGSLYGGTVAP